MPSQFKLEIILSHLAKNVASNPKSRFCNLNWAVQITKQFTIFDKCDTKLKPLDFTFFCFIRNLVSAFFVLVFSFSLFTLLAATQNAKTIKKQQKPKCYDDRKIKITEVPEFSIWPYTQNRKFGNLGRFSFTSNFDTGYIWRLKTKKNELRQKLKITEVFEFSIGPPILDWHW